MEKVVTVGTAIKLHGKEEIKNTYKSLYELASLVSTAQGVVIHSFLVKRDKIDPAYYIGKGKAEEIGNFVEKFNIRTVVFDNELTPAQIRNLEKIINAKIVDRTRLILDIFAQRAHTKEAQLQVELAQLQYMLPRLTQKGIHMDNQVGGIGTRGPGETKLEYDRRKIMLRIEKIKEELEKVTKARTEQKKLRIESNIPLVAIIGYTNSGKSTLFNTLLKSSQAYADDKLFATLDPLIRKLQLPKGTEVLIIDTVGFINKLPHHLIESFRSTLEIVKDATLLLEVVDLTSEDYQQREVLVQEILQQIGITDIPIVKVYNKIDLLPEKIKRMYLNNSQQKIVISAKTGFGIDFLLRKIETILSKFYVLKTVKIKHDDYNTLGLIYKHCKIISNSVKDGIFVLKIRTTKTFYSKLLQLIRK
ncbi:MAG: GTPase HflX [Endomicrobia bacterium]|nr:GTPase HflX [Endomicrobiia bacterium]MDW8055375.1 GTPase HflX [Elusimicrobiota bacterium]